MAFQKGHHVNKGIPKTEEHKRKISLARIGTGVSGEARKKMSLVRKGKHHSEETRRKMSEAKKGVKHHNWKGGITSINATIRSSVEYRLWREAVFKRDNWTCVWCKVRGEKLNADHIKSFAQFPEIRFAIDNGRTLCVPCHKKTASYLNRYYKD